MSPRPRQEGVHNFHTYKNHGCRCDACKTDNARRSREYRQMRNATVVCLCGGSGWMSIQPLTPPGDKNLIPCTCRVVDDELRRVLAYTESWPS